MQVDIVRSETGLVTLRTEKQTLFVLFSATLGSVFGMMGIFKYIMNIVEYNFLNIRYKNKRTALINSIQESSIKLDLNMNNTNAILPEDIEGKGELEEKGSGFTTKRSGRVLPERLIDRSLVVDNMMLDDTRLVKREISFS